MAAYSSKRLGGCLQHFWKLSKFGDTIDRDFTDQIAVNEMILNKAVIFVNIQGTLWCGNGNKADNEDDLGSFTEVDMCCREHDHCPRTVGAFKKQYGFRNLFLFTVSDCRCDFMFYTCLKNVEDHKVAAKLVGKMFFNVLRMPCLRFNQEGTEAFKTHSRRFK